MPKAARLARLHIIMMARVSAKPLLLGLLLATGPVLADHIPGMPRWTGHAQPAEQLEPRHSPLLPLEPGATEGDPEAAWRLARLYDEGTEVSGDKVQAAKWYYVAAVQGNPFAQHRLAQFYEKGIGVEQNLAKAVRWYQLASLEGLESAETELTRLLAPRAVRIGAERAYVRGAPGGTPDTGILMEVHAGEELFAFRDGSNWIEVYLPIPDLWGWLRTSALDADPALFGEPLTITNRERMRQKLAAKGLPEIGAQDQPWIDVFDSSGVLAWSQTLTLGYVPRDGRLAFAEYRFPQRPGVSGLNTLDGVRELISGKYGQPQRVPATADWQEYQWERGTVTIRVAGNEQGPVILAYEQPDAMLLLENDLKDYRQYRRLERAIAEGDAY